MKATPDPDILRRLMAERNLTASSLAEATAKHAGRRVDHKTIARALRGEPVTMHVVARLRATLKAVPVDDGPDFLAS